MRLVNESGLLPRSSEFGNAEGRKYRISGTRPPCSWTQESFKQIDGELAVSKDFVE